MPNAIVLEQKQKQVAEISEKLSNSCAGVVVDYKGINVADDTALRKELREAGVDYFVVKNTLLGRAIEGTDLAEMKNVLEGTTAIAISKEDHVAAARILCKFAESHEGFTVKSGFLDGEVIDVAKVEALAATPSKPVLVCKIMGSMMSPLYGLAYALQAIIDKSGEAPAEEAPAEAAAE